MGRGVRSPPQSQPAPPWSHHGVPMVLPCVPVVLPRFQFVPLWSHHDPTQDPSQLPHGPAMVPASLTVVSSILGGPTHPTVDHPCLTIVPPWGSHSPVTVLARSQPVPPWSHRDPTMVPSMIPQQSHAWSYPWSHHDPTQDPTNDPTMVVPQSLPSPTSSHPYGPNPQFQPIPTSVSVPQPRVPPHPMTHPVNDSGPTLLEEVEVLRAHAARGVEEQVDVEGPLAAQHDATAQGRVCGTPPRVTPAGGGGAVSMSPLLRHRGPPPDPPLWGRAPASSRTEVRDAPKPSLTSSGRS